MFSSQFFPALLSHAAEADQHKGFTRHAGPSQKIHTGETEEGYIIRVELPGVSPEAVNIEHEGHTLEIQAKDAINQAFRIPEDADLKNTRASLVDGIMTVAVPRSAQGQESSIDVKDKLPKRPESEDEGYYVTLNVPGLGQADMKASVEPSRGGGRKLKLTGKSSHKGVANDIDRSFTLPKDADAAKTEVGVQYGVAAAKLPKIKTEEREVKVTGEGGASREDDVVLLREKVPGASPENAQAVIEGRQLHVGVQMDTEEKGVKRQRTVRRASQLPAGAEAGQVKVVVHNGVLEAFVPKSAISDTTTHVKISTGEHAQLEAPSA